ncbi:hypothetical protein SAMN02745671_01009 [Anaerovibrio lipolyticus DSM 3074]|uniref:Uncharacterized protein n=1 Tax=Anaerovibrio lipolyticus DSM 3074 TaxID=1120997 RepID=A0A1M6C5J3_9FIRM|nr:hypothetical protein SAMN02745671_01009 [Anaerovibrio lipolyticus DSM 3074]
MRRYDVLMEKMNPQNMACFIVGVVPCEYCAGPKLPERCEYEGFKCEEGIKAYLEQEVEHE